MDLSGMLWLLVVDMPCPMEEVLAHCLVAMVSLGAVFSASALLPPDMT